MPGEEESTEFGEGTLGRIKSANGWSYQLTWDDILWAARMLPGEAGREAASAHGAAILWSQAQRLYKLGRRWTYTSLIRAHSQPINPKWLANGQFCLPGGQGHGTNLCSPAAMANRAAIQSMPWESINPDVRTHVINWARGRVNNPVPKAIDFAWPRVGNKSVQPAYPNGRVTDGYFNLVWDSKGRPPASMEINSNSFWSVTTGRLKTSDWPPNFIRIEWEENQTTETTPAQIQANNLSSPVGAPLASRDDENRAIVERILAITNGRTDTPDVKMDYSVIATEGELESRDKNASGFVDEIQQGDILSAPSDRFYTQMSALRDVTDLDLAQAVPVLAIYVAPDDDQTSLVNLNDLIFSKPAEIFDENTMVQNADRPIASITDFHIKIQSPSVGGPTGIMIGTLNIKIHNPWAVNDHHPVGKYISYMFRQGYSMKIRYGVATPTDPASQAFQTVEESFFISQQEINTSDDLSISLKLTLMPASNKLFNQVLIGESLPTTEITGRDLNLALQAAVKPETTEAQRSQMSSDLQEIRSTFNGIASNAIHHVTNADGTIRSSLHGAISNLEIINDPDATQRVRVENLVTALKTIQSQILTRRYEEIFDLYAYKFTAQARAELDYAAINLGVLINSMVRPEIEYIVGIVAASRLFGVGPVYSIDGGQSTTPRRNVKIIFGNFNSLAGQWAGKPLSVFPINLETILAYLRRERTVGRFSDTMNGFISRCGSIMSDMSNYVVDGTSGRIELPELKYSFYPDPTDPSGWIFYFFDNKDRIVRFTEVMGAFDDRRPERAEVKEFCEAHKIPWIEFGNKNSLVRSLSAGTKGDDMIMSHNMLQANEQAFSQRNLDASRLPTGLSREFLSGMQLDSNQIISNHILIMPLKVSVDYYISVSALLFSPIYLFFPIKMFTGVYTIYEVAHKISNGKVSTDLTLMIQITRANRQPD
jgi:hypothetical protein